MLWHLNMQQFKPDVFLFFLICFIIENKIQNSNQTNQQNETKYTFNSNNNNKEKNVQKIDFFSIIVWVL